LVEKLISLVGSKGGKKITSKEKKRETGLGWNP
jgi:hypothetical protein